MRTVVLFIACMALARVSAQDAGKPMPEQEAAHFWGVAHSIMSWSKVEGPDFDVYYGHAKPPLRGGVGIYIGGHPSFDPAADAPGACGRLGTYDVRWFESREEDGPLRKEGLVHISDYQIFHLWIYGPAQSDIAALEKELATYPVFSLKSAAAPTK